MNVKESHIVTGMSRDSSVSKQNPNMVYDARNIRITVQGNNNTLMSVTNERGTQDITLNTTDSIKTETNSQNPSINIVSNNNSNNNNIIINTENIQDSTSPDNIPINTGENAFETCIFFLFMGGILIIALYGCLRSFK